MAGSKIEERLVRNLYGKSPFIIQRNTDESFLGYVYVLLDFQAAARQLNAKAVCAGGNGQFYVGSKTDLIACTDRVLIEYLLFVQEHLNAVIMESLMQIDTQFCHWRAPITLLLL